MNTAGRRTWIGIAILALYISGLGAVQTADADEPVFCHGHEVTNPAFIGTEGQDFIAGTSGNDVIQLFGGNDFVQGVEGRDIICGGQGNDLIYGDGCACDGGNDLIYGDGDDDYLVGDSSNKGGDDRILGGSGNDFIQGDSAEVSGGDDLLNGNSGDDTMYGDGSGSETFVPGANDSCNGSRGSGDSADENCETVTNVP